VIAIAGMGPAPKANGRRARKNKDAVPSTTVRFERADQPQLPEIDEPWHPQTLAWWKMWADSPLSDNFGTTDWEFLLDTALIHHWYWSGDQRVAGELRLRVAKFGATPEDRARLRIQFADADQRDEGRGNASEKSARERFGNVTKADFKKSS